MGRTLKYFKAAFPKEFYALVRFKISLGKRGNQNGYSGPPRPLIEKSALASALKNGWNRDEMRTRFKVSDFLLDRNLRWHSLTEDYAKSAELSPIRRLNRNAELRRLIATLSPDFFKSVFDAPEKSVECLFRLFIRLSFLNREVKAVGKLLASRRSQGRSPFSFISNPGELEVADYLLTKQVPFEMQFILGQFMYDFCLPTFRMLVEVDGSSHRMTGSDARDFAKTKAARDAGYRLLRIPYSGKGKTDFNRLDKLCA